MIRKNHTPKKLTYYKGKRIDNLGYNLGKRFAKNHEIFIAPYRTSTKSGTNRGYHYCDQVIPESVCRDTGIYDSQNVIICLYDILKDNITNVEYFVYEVGWHSTLYGSILTEDIKNFKDPTEEINYETMTHDFIKISLTNSSQFTIIGHMYDYIDAYRYLKDFNNSNSFKAEDLRKYLAPGNFVMTRDKNIFLIQPSSTGLRLVNRQFEYYGGGIQLFYSARLNYKGNRHMDIIKIHICTNHNDSIRLWKSFFNDYPILDWSSGDIIEDTRDIEWDWSRYNDNHKKN